MYLQNIFHLCRTDIAQIDLCGSSGSEEECSAVELSTISIERTGKTYIEEDHCSSDEDHCSSDEEISYYNDDLSLPVFQKGLKGKSFSAVDIVSCILFVERSDIICSVVPTQIQDDVVFMVDHSSFEHMEDLKSDDLGVWKSNKVASNYFLINGYVNLILYYSF